MKWIAEWARGASGILVLAVGVAGHVPAARAAGAANDHTVLILGSTVTGGAGSIEAQKAALAGMDVEIVDAAGWAAKSAADFASYRALVLGDPTCQGPGTGSIAAAEANASTWGPQVDGNVIIMGTDEVYHDVQGGNLLSEKAMAFAVDEVGRTGAFISLSCYYHGTPPLTPVPLLNDAFGPSFTLTGVGCYNDAHIVATSPALVGITDATLSNWSCSVHEAFDSWPASFDVLAIAEGIGASFTASDGTIGTPYVLARGPGVVALGLSLTPSTATNPVGTTHAVTATLTDSSGSSVSGALIGFEVIAGPNAGASGTCSPADCRTDAAGVVTFTYLGAGGPGVDSIQAFADENGSGAADPGEPQDTAQKTWEIAVTTTTTTTSTTTTTTAPADCVAFPCGRNGTKQTICHVPPGNPRHARTLCIGADAVPSHLVNHGDYCGPCE